MPDYGARYTDQQIDEIEKRIAALYDTAYSDIDYKYRKFIQRFKAKDKELRQKLADGEITKAQYDAWLRGQIFQGRKWNAQLSDIAKTLTDSTIIAADIANEHAENVFAMNANYATYEIEKAGNIDMGFGLYDEDAVRRLVRDNPALLPPSRVDIPREQRWNMDLINRQIGVGIVTGEGIEAIAKRLRRAAVMSANQARTHARTAMTGAQNAGRIEGYKRAEGLGIKLEKEWLATLDGHTRRSHAMLDGQHVPTDQPFKSLLGDIMYPGDPSARPANVYNCRCTLISHLLEYPSQNAMRRPNLQKLGDGEVQKPIKDMTYAEWAGWKREKKPQGWRRQFMRQPEKLYTRDEVEKRMLANGIVEKIFLPEDIPTETAKLIETVFSKFKQRGYPTLRQIVYQPQLCAQRGAIAFYDEKTNGIYLGARFKNEPKKLNEMLLEAKRIYDAKSKEKEWEKYGAKAIAAGENDLKNAKDGYEKYKAYKQIETGLYLLGCGKKNTVCETMEDILNHEFGHMLHLYSRVKVPNTVKSGTEWSEKWNAKNILPYRQASQLGAYAIKNPLEAVAEAFAAREKGEHVPEFYLSILSDIDKAAKENVY